MIKWIILATDNTERLSIYLLFIGALRIFIELLSFPSGCHHVKWEIIFVVIIHVYVSGSKISKRVRKE